MAQLPGIALAQQVPIKVIGRWLKRLDKSDMLGLTWDIIDESVKTCDAEKYCCFGPPPPLSPRTALIPVPAWC